MEPFSNKDINPTEGKNQDPPLYQELCNSGHEDWAISLSNCGLVHRTLTCAICGDAFQKPIRYRCKLKLCERCAKRKAKQIRKKFLPALQEMRHLKLLTLTIKNTKTIEEGFEKLRSSLRKLRQRKDFKWRFKGGLYALEVTYNKNTETFHCHAHLLVSLFWISQERLSRVWAECNGGDPVVDIRAIRNVKKALAYVTSYISKGVSQMLDQWPLEKLIHFMETTIKCRMIHSIGALHGLVFPKRKLVCPFCNESIFIFRDRFGNLVFDQLESLQRRAFDSS